LLHRHEFEDWHASKRRASPIPGAQIDRRESLVSRPSTMCEDQRSSSSHRCDARMYPARKSSRITASSNAFAFLFSTQQMLIPWVAVADVGARAGPHATSAAPARTTATLISSSQRKRGDASLTFCVRGPCRDARDVARAPPIQQNSLLRRFGPLVRHVFAFCSGFAVGQGRGRRLSEIRATATLVACVRSQRHESSGDRSSSRR